MLLHRIRGLWTTYHGILAFVLTFVLWAYLMLFGGLRGISPESYPRFILLDLAGVAGLAIAAIRGRSAAATLLAGGFVESHLLALKQTVYVGVTMLVVVFAATDLTASWLQGPLLLFGFLALLYVVFLICHLLVPKRFAEAVFSSHEREQRTLLIGPVDKAREISKWIEETHAFGFGIKGVPTRDDGEEEESQLLHFAHVSDVKALERAIASFGIRQIILLEVPPDREALSLLLDTARRAGVRVLITSNLDEIFGHEVSHFGLHNKSFIGLRDEPLEEIPSRVFKRMIDLFVSLPVVIFILPPACLVVKIFQAIQAPGPLFDRQTRSGLANRPFKIFNFRTTQVKDMGGARLSGSDRGVYPLASFMRARGLHQLPEFLNVFLDQMSVVGPSPRAIIVNRRFSEIATEYHVRAWAKPGVTGLAQISGFCGECRDDRDVLEATKLDIKYIEHWSLPLDFWIIFKALLQIVKPPKTAFSA